MSMFTDTFANMFANNLTIVFVPTGANKHVRGASPPCTSKRFAATIRKHFRNDVRNDVCKYVRKRMDIYGYIKIETQIIEYGLEATPSIFPLQIIFLAARRDYGGDYYGASQEL